MSVRDNLIAQAKGMPQMPAPVMRIMSYMSDPDADLNVVAALIEYDPGLTINVLRMANSSFFGGGGKITLVRDAIFRLGTRRIVQLVIASGVAPNTRGAVSGYGLAQGELLRLSISVGIAAELIAAEVGMKAPDHTFTAGLLSNIGKVVMGRFLELDAEPVISLAAREGISFEQAERQMFDIDHAELGATLLAHWELPEPIVNCVRWHLNPNAAPERDPAVDLVHVGHVLSTMAGIGQGVDGLQYEVCQESFDRLSLTPQVMTVSLENLVQNIEEVEGILSQV